MDCRTEINLGFLFVCQSFATYCEKGLGYGLRPDRLTLVAGYHRLEACKKLGWDSIPVHTINVNDLDRELSEIDENLIRNELTELEQSLQLNRRKEIYLIKYPETKQGSYGGRGSKKNESDTMSFSKDTSKKRNDTMSFLFQAILPKRPARTSAR